MIHSHILLDSKLKSLAEERRWKEYNTNCSLRSNNLKLKKIDVNKLRIILNQGLLEEKLNICAVCFTKYDICV